jgi:hypothetical protein
LHQQGTRAAEQHGDLTVNLPRDGIWTEVPEVA